LTAKGTIKRGWLKVADRLGSPRLGENMPRKLGLLRWLLRKLSTDDEDMIAFVASLPDADDDDLQALLEELATPQTEATPAPLRVEYQTGKQLIPPTEARRILNLPRAIFYGLLKRGTFPCPMLINGTWVGWPRDILLQWADASERKKIADTPHGGYAPFERNLWRKST
jgi:predicted DNA-binding transcriptional regulator AlpA